MTDKNSLAFWFPKLADRYVPVPRTKIVFTPQNCDLIELLDGKTPDGYGHFIMDLRAAMEEIGTPCFLRTGHGSDKHGWEDTCYVKSPLRIEGHVGRLVEWSSLVDLMGLPTDVWAVRELIQTEPLFYAFNHMPITREFRIFARDEKIDEVFPYWPADAIENPDRDDWAERLDAASHLGNVESELLTSYALDAVRAVGGGYWSVDFLQDRDGNWFLTDMADGDRSYRPDREEKEYPMPHPKSLGGAK